MHDFDTDVVRKWACGTDNLLSDINLIGLRNKLGKFLRWDAAEIKHRMFVDVSVILHVDDDVLPFFDNYFN